MKRIVGFAAVLAVALVLLATPGLAVTGVTGTATTNNTIFAVSVGSTGARLGIDVADVVNGSTVKATSKLITGKVGSFTIPGGQSRTATRSSESGKESIKPGTQPIQGIGSLTIAGGFIQSTVAADHVGSAVDFAAGAVDALDGLVGVATMDSTTNARVDAGASSVERLLTIGDVDALNLGSLLDNLGIDPLALACDAVSDAGAALGIGAQVADACDQLSAVETDLTGGLTEIDATETVLATLETALAPLCLLAPGTCDPITGQIDALQAEIDGIQADAPDTCATVGEALDEVSSQLDGIIATLNVLDVGGLLGDLDTLIAPVTSQLGDVDSASSTLQDACETLLGTVDALLDTPVLVLDGVQLAMNLVADRSPTASATGTIGALKVGTVTVADADDLAALGTQLAEAIDGVNQQLATVFQALGLSGMPVPQLDLLKVTTSKGKRSDGTYFAEATMRAAHLVLPSAVVDVPATLPLDVLGGIGGFGIASFRAAAVTTPAIVVDAGVFTGAATFKPGTAGSGGTLPNTGLGATGMAVAGLVSLAGARLVRRITRVF